MSKPSAFVHDTLIQATDGEGLLAARGIILRLHDGLRWEREQAERDSDEHLSDELHEIAVAENATELCLRRITDALTAAERLPSPVEEMAAWIAAAVQANWESGGDYQELRSLIAETIRSPSPNNPFVRYKHQVSKPEIETEIPF